MGYQQAVEVGFAKLRSTQPLLLGTVNSIISSGYSPRVGSVSAALSPRQRSVPPPVSPRHVVKTQVAEAPVIPQWAPAELVSLQMRQNPHRPVSPPGAAGRIFSFPRLSVS